MPQDDVSLRIRLRNAGKFNRDARKAASEIDNIGDQAAQAARRLATLSAASTRTRVNLGPFSTSMRGGALAVGGLILATEKFVPQAVAAAEAVATMAGGGAAAGGVGLLALGQAAGTAKLGLGGLTDALGGSKQAMQNLAPELQDLFTLLSDNRDTLQATAREGIVPGITRGAEKASRNMRVLDGIVGKTARKLGSLGNEAGGMLGSPEWGRDMRTLGNQNVRIIDSLGHGTLDLADATRHLAVEAAPLAVWLADAAERGAHLTDVWVENKRRTGELAQFFRDARRDLRLLASAAGHGGRGLINLFGAGDVDGTKTLRNLDQMLARFERWSKSPGVKKSLGDAIVAEIPDAVAAAMDAIARNLPGSAGRAAKVFWDAFWGASLEGKALMFTAAAAKLGAFKQLGKLMGRGGALGMKGGLGGPVPVFVTNPGWGGPGGPAGRGKGGPLNTIKKLGPLAVGASGPVAVGAGSAAGILAPLLLLGRQQHGPVSPLQDRAAAQRQANQLGFPTTQAFDAQGFPIGPSDRAPTDPFHPDPFGRPFEIRVVLADGTVIAKTTQRGNAKRRARGTR